MSETASRVAYQPVWDEPLPIDGINPTKSIIPKSVSPNGVAYTPQQRAHIKKHMETLQILYGVENVKPQRELQFDFDGEHWELFVWVDKIARVLELEQNGYRFVGGLSTTSDLNSKTFENVLEWLQKDKGYQLANIEVGPYVLSRDHKTGQPIIRDESIGFWVQDQTNAQA